METVKKIFFFVMMLTACVMTFTFSACGGDDDGGGGIGGGSNGGGNPPAAFNVVGTWRYYFQSNDPSRGMVYNLLTFNSDHTGYLIEEVGYGGDKPEPFSWSQTGNTIRMTFSNSESMVITITSVTDNNTVVLSYNGTSFTAYKEGGSNGGGNPPAAFSIVGTWRYYFQSNDPSRGMVYNLLTFNSDHTGYLIEEVGYGGDKPEPFSWSQTGNTIRMTYSNSESMVVTIMSVTDNNTVVLSYNGTSFTAYKEEGSNGGGNPPAAFSIVGTWRYYFQSNDPSRGMVYNLLTFNSDHTGYLIEEVGYGGDKPEPFSWSQTGNTIRMTYSNSESMVVTITSVTDNNTVVLSYNGTSFTAYKVEGSNGGLPNGNGYTTDNDTINNPMTVAEVYDIVAAMPSDEVSSFSYCAKGKISSIKYPFSAEYGTAVFNISDTGYAGGKELTAYNAYYLDFQSKWTEYYPQIAVGDDVLVYGRVVNYHGTTPEFADRKCYVIPLPVPQYGK